MVKNATKKGAPMKRSAFTMLELVMVIVVIGILTALAIPRLNRDLRQEAQTNIVSALRYTQNLALSDDKTNPSDPNWQQTLWAIQFYDGNNAYYRIGSDMDKSGAISKIESAIDTQNGKYFFNSSGVFSSKASDESPIVFLGHNYGINTITASSGCNKMIAFDHLGRPHTGLKSIPIVTVAGHDYATYMSSDCTLTFGFSNSDIDDLNITIRTETGYISSL